MGTMVNLMRNFGSCTSLLESRPVADLFFPPHTGAYRYMGRKERESSGTGLTRVPFFTHLFVARVKTAR